jgi:hypothetical protein
MESLGHGPILPARQGRWPAGYSGSFDPRSGHDIRCCALEGTKATHAKRRLPEQLLARASAASVMVYVPDGRMGSSWVDQLNSMRLKQRTSRNIGGSSHIFVMDSCVFPQSVHSDSIGSNM